MEGGGLCPSAATTICNMVANQQVMYGLNTIPHYLYTDALGDSLSTHYDIANRRMLRAAFKSPIWGCNEAIELDANVPKVSD